MRSQHRQFTDRYPMGISSESDLSKMNNADRHHYRQLSDPYQSLLSATCLSSVNGDWA